jgi:hypothetical protein
MEQAALTYSSKTTMGVSVAAGTADTPGLDVAIGFKEINAALVPVAVAKYCYKATAEQCQKTIYAMRLISGGKRDEIESLPIEKRISDINQDLEQVIDQQKSQTTRLGELRAAISQNEAVNAANVELAKLGPAADNESLEVQSRRSELAETLALQQPGLNLSQARTEVAHLEKLQLTHSARISTLREEQGQLTKQLGSNRNRKRDDAFSVYGKFNGNAGGNSQGASLTAGKVFATGVAAQNLTEYATTSECLANVRVLVDLLPTGKDAEKATLIASAAEVCKPGF